MATFVLAHGAWGGSVIWRRIAAALRKVGHEVYTPTLVRDYIERKSSAQPVACFTQPVKLSGGIGRIRRKTYIYCNDPAPTTFTPFYERLRNDPGWTVHTLPCTHFVQFDMPEELTALLLGAIPPGAMA